jgi:mRNA interferase MazF
MAVVTALDVLRGHIYLVSLDPTIGQEIQKTKPCVVLSPDELNAHMSTCIIAPMTTASRAYPFRIACQFQGKARYVVLDQMRTVDRARLVRKLGRLSSPALENALRVLEQMFAP